MAASRVGLLFLLFVCFVFKESTGDEGILCTEQFCRNYGFDVGCPNAPALQFCRTNNATHSGISLPSPTECNCCEFCLAFILEGQSCPLGGPGDGTTVGRCGPGLTCVAETDGNRCRRMESTCHSHQDDYDERSRTGEVGFLEERPRCDHKGLFAPSSCVSTQTCFCQSDGGERIFGETEYRDSNSLLRMQCACSRRNYDIHRNIGPGVPEPVIGPRCTQDGGFQPVQCDGRTCYCVDRLSGAITGSHRINLDELSIRELPCYDRTLDIFDYMTPDDAEPPFNYTTPCVEEQDERTQLILQSEREGYIVDYFTTPLTCLPDGTYGRISTAVDGRKTCTTERGVQIDDYNILPGARGYEDMDCKCALTSHLLRDRVERPVCCRNGNFRPLQCRRGLCYCVDSDGRQVDKETSDVGQMQQLSCYSDDWRTC